MQRKIGRSGRGGGEAIDLLTPGPNILHLVHLSHIINLLKTIKDCETKAALGLLPVRHWDPKVVLLHVHHA
jgi:hypothetical protein